MREGERLRLLRIRVACAYFLDKMQVKLNEKMRRDDELERMRR